jgi:lipopolysaccharide biosynthesis protein
VKEYDVCSKYVSEMLRNAHKAASYEQKRENPVSLKDDSIKVISFYLPQFHQIKENDEWWGEGFTEWTNVTRAAPQFLGHYQPHLPDALGFYDLSNIKAISRQVELAKFYGVYGFCFYYYWFSGRKLLEKPLELVMSAKEIDFPFCICWANENWTRTWDGHQDNILVAQEYCDKSDIAFIRDILPIIKDERYIHIGGKPLLIIYRPEIIPDLAERISRWRSLLHELGGIEAAIYTVLGFGLNDPQPYGLDGMLEFPPHNVGFGLAEKNEQYSIVNPDYEGEIVPYEDMVRNAKKINRERPSYPVIRGACPSWDNEARKPGRGWTLAGATPTKFEGWMREIRDYTINDPRNNEKYVFVNAWNEWAEGAHLEPDRRYGYGYLNALARIIED